MFSFEFFIICFQERKKDKKKESSQEGREGRREKRKAVHGSTWMHISVDVRLLDTAEGALLPTTEP